MLRKGVAREDKDTRPGRRGDPWSGIKEKAWTLIFEKTQSYPVTGLVPFDSDPLIIGFSLTLLPQGSQSLRDLRRLVSSDNF